MSEPKVASVPPDLYPYLNEIAERLFSGHAAVMIGSGFSRNAQPAGWFISPVSRLVWAGRPVLRETSPQKA